MLMVAGLPKVCNFMYLFKNYPRKVSKEFYANAREKIVKHYSSNESIVSIYEYGSVSSPGVSDLDIMLIMREDSKVSNQELDFRHIDKDVFSLVQDGNVMKMTRDVFKNLNLLDAFHVKKIFGKDIPMVAPSDEDKDMLELISIVDWLPERILRLTRVINDKTINISNVLCILHSFLYSIKRIDKMIPQAKKSEDLIEAIGSLRNNWHDLSNPENILVSVIKNSISLGYLYLNNFKEHAINLECYQDIDNNFPDNIEIEIFNNHFMRFVGKGFEPDLECSSGAMSNSLQAFVSVPGMFYAHFYHLSIQDGTLSESLRHKINPYILSRNKLQEKYKANLTRKMKIASKNAKFLMENNFKGGLIRYGFHL
jgi:hypothetical protein